MSRKHGFTLIELLVVISIVSLLMAILLSTLGRVRKLARATGCLSNVRQWGIALHARAADAEGMVLGRWDSPWWQEIRAYYDSDDLLLCPEASRPGPFAYVQRTPFEAWQYPKEYRYGPVVGSYGANHWLMETSGIKQHGDEWGWPGNAYYDIFVSRHWYWSGRDLRRPGAIPLLGGCIGEAVLAEETDVPPAFHGDFVLRKWRLGGWGRNVDQMKTVCLDRHGHGRTNMTFMDGSSRPVGLKELWTLKWYKGCSTTGPWTNAGGVSPGDWPQWMRKFKDY